jgi:hypothetical protein
MKKTLITIFAAFALFASTAFAGIGTYGYIDLFYDNGPSGDSTGVYEFEYGMEFSEEGSPFSAVMELSFTGSEDVSFETATVTYASSDELSFTIGNILSYQGFEAYDQTGMYQYSYQGDGPVYSAAYAVGASVDYVTDDYSIGVWVGDTDTDDSFEYLFAYTGIEGVTAKYIYADDPSYETDNFWISYETGDLTLAYETTETTGAGACDIEMYLAYLAMGDAGLTVRLSDGEIGGYDYEKFTVSPSYAFSDAVFGLIEYSDYESDDPLIGDDSFTAVEVLYTF